MNRRSFFAMIAAAFIWNRSCRKKAAASARKGPIAPVLSDLEYMRKYPVRIGPNPFRVPFTYRQIVGTTITYSQYRSYLWR